MDEGLLLLLVFLLGGAFVSTLLLLALQVVLEVLDELGGLAVLLGLGQLEEHAVLRRDLLAGDELVICDEDALQGADDGNREQHAGDAAQGAAHEDRHENERGVDVDRALHELGRDDVADDVVDDHVDHDRDEAHKRRDEERDDRDDRARDHGADVGHEIKDAAQEAQNHGVGDAENEEAEPARDTRDERAEQGRLGPPIDGGAKGVGHDVNVVLVFLVHEAAHLTREHGEVEQNPERADERDEGDEDDVTDAHDAAHDAVCQAAGQRARLLADEGCRLREQRVDALAVEELRRGTCLGDKVLDLREIPGELLGERGELLDDGGDEHHEAGHDDGDDEQERDGRAAPTGDAVSLEPVDEAVQQKDEQRRHDDDGHGLPDDAGDVEQNADDDTDADDGPGPKRP